MNSDRCLLDVLAEVVAQLESERSESKPTQNVMVTLPLADVQTVVDVGITGYLQATGQMTRFEAAATLANAFAVSPNMAYEALHRIMDEVATQVPGSFRSREESERIAQQLCSASGRVPD